MSLNNSNLYDGTKDLISSLNNDYTFFSFEASNRNEIGFSNPLLDVLKPDFTRQRPSSIVSREDFKFTARRDLSKQKVEFELFNLFNVNLTAKTYSNYMAIKVILLPYIFLLLLFFIIIFVFKIDLII